MEIQYKINKSEIGIMDLILDNKSGKLKEEPIYSMVINFLCRKYNRILKEIISICSKMDYNFIKMGIFSYKTINKYLKAKREYRI